MKYKIIIEKRAEKFIKKQPYNQQKRILKSIYLLPNSGDIKKLKDQHDFFRLRVGDYRIIFNLKNDILTVVVTNADNRGQIYK